MAPPDAPSHAGPRHVVVVPHTHWDREWYAPFQTFRLRLIDLLDDLLPRLEADPGYGHFLLDGQMAVVDDYLAIRPEAKARLRRLAVSGRLAMGPWYILMDEFLVSGETMIRNLQLGLERAAAFGGAMEVGYLPDMFGHVAQMPQLLAQFGFDHAVVWRGVPRAMTTPGFWWEAPDGSTVRAQYLPEGYGNGASLPDDAKELVAMIGRFETTYGNLAGDAATPLLWMNGTDHQAPRPWLGRVVAEANALQDDYRLEVGSLAAYLAAAPTEGLDRVAGELRSGAHANLLMGVASNRVDVHRATVVTERWLEQLAEPLCALWQPEGRWPGALLDAAWREVILNSAHDSVCACSLDEVGDAVLHRYAEARHIGEGLTERAVGFLARSLGGERPIVLNPSARPRQGLVEITLAGGADIPGTQRLRLVGGDRVVDGMTCATLLPIVQGALDGFDDIVDGSVEVDGDGAVEVRLARDPSHVHGKWNGPVRGDLMRLAVEAPDAPARLVTSRPRAQRVLVRTEPVPGYGWRRVGTGAEAEAATASAVRPVTVDGFRIANGLVTVEVDEAAGTFAIDGLTGFGRLVDDGDEGDTYNYSPPDGDLVVDLPDTVETTVIESGPLRARVRVAASYHWPERVTAHARTGGRDVLVETVIEVHAGERLVRVTTSFDNTCRDHRLRVWFPLPEPAAASRAECAFGITTRGLDGEGGPTERALPTFPSRRFVQAGGLTVVHEGLLEYELVERTGAGDHERAGALALTLLRATGMLSQGPMRYRPLPAGPLIALEGPQLAGPQVARYALQVGDASPHALVDDAFLPLLVAEARAVPGMASSPVTGGETGQALDVRGAVVSALTRVGEHLQIRVFNPTDRPTTLTIAGRTGWLVDLRGAPGAPFDGECELAPWRIATILLS